MVVGCWCAARLRIASRAASSSNLVSPAWVRVPASSQPDSSSLEMVMIYLSGLWVPFGKFSRQQKSCGHSEPGKAANQMVYRQKETRSATPRWLPRDPAAAPACSLVGGCTDVPEEVISGSVATMTGDCCSCPEGIAGMEGFSSPPDSTQGHEGKSLQQQLRWLLQVSAGAGMMLAPHSVTWRRTPSRTAVTRRKNICSKLRLKWICFKLISGARLRPRSIPRSGGISRSVRRGACRS